MDLLSNELINISKKIANFIKKWFSHRNGFECRTFYGETFSLALFAILDNLDETIIKKLIENYSNMDKNDPQFHWEFNNYALLQYLKNSNDKEIYALIYPLKFKNTPCTNWTLLRSNARLLANQDINLAIKEAKKKIKKFQLPSGLILDEKKVKSFQYHCFSMAMIAEIYEQTGIQLFYDSFLLGVNFIRKFILSNGDVLYIGRGQKQSFGYGALIYILSLTYKYTLDKTILGDMKKVIDFLLKYQNQDGSFPLMLNGITQPIPEIVDIKNPAFAGWYPYNNYFDYLPFMGYFIAKASNVLKELDTSEVKISKSQDYQDSDFIKIATQKYESVICKTGGYWTNDMPIPYIVSDGQNITPCYGGEQFQASLYSLKGLPLPYCKLVKKSIRWRSFSFLRNNVLWIISPLGIMKRIFIFKKDSIEIKTKIYSLFKFTNLYLFKMETEQQKDDELSIYRISIFSHNPLKFKGYQYSADGKIKLFEDKNKNSCIKIKFN